MPPFGYNSFVGWVQESTWGTPVSPPTKFAEIVSESLKTIRTREPRPVLRQRDHNIEGGMYDAKHGAAGGFVIEANYGNLLRLIEHAFGDSSVATVLLEAATSWTHTATLKDTPMVGKGLTIYKNADLDGATPTSQYAGFKIESLKLTYEPTRNAQLEIEGAAKDHADVATPTATYPTLANYVAGHQTVLEIDDVARSFDSAEVMIANGLDLDKRIMGAKTIDEPRVTNPREVTGTITLDALAADLAKFKAGTLFKLELISTGPALGVNNFKWTVTALKCELTEDPITIDNFGVLKSTLTYRALKPTSGELLQFDIVNDESAVA